ncbi:MAG: relaxase domain-containing protein, partial [Symploca sp. SIO2G7]|nr:relaxase domain-containing protein [Symploca sp. SIO2G7]
MLSVQRIRNKNYHIDLAREDYYQTGGEAPGIWHGTGAELLGLKAGEKVSRDNLHNLMDGLSPEGSHKLVQNAGAGKVIYRNRQGVLQEREREIGWDFTLSAPKSLSIIWSQADLRTRKTVEKIHATAVKKTLDWLELHATTRRGKGGAKRESSKLVIAMFPHSTSRAVDNHLPDPQLHTHCLVMNLGVREDGTTGAIEINRLLENKMIVGALYRAELAKQIGERLGYEIGAHIQEKGEDEADSSVKKQGNLFEVKGVKKELVLEFSKRRRKIKQKLQDRGEESAVAAEVATLNTREHKGEIPPRDELFEIWQRIGQRFGYEPPVPKFPQRNVEKMRREAGIKALDNVLTKQGTFSQKDVLRSVAEIAPFYGLGIEEIKLVVGAQLAQDDIVCLGQINGESRYSTKEIIPIEKGRVAAVDASKLLE